MGPAVPALGRRPPHLCPRPVLAHEAVEAHLLLEVVDVPVQEAHLLRAVGEVTLGLALHHEECCGEGSALVTGRPAPRGSGDFQGLPPGPRSPGPSSPASRAGKTSSAPEPIGLLLATRLAWRRQMWPGRGPHHRLLLGPSTAETPALSLPTTSASTRLPPCSCECVVRTARLPNPRCL